MRRAVLRWRYSAGSFSFQAASNEVSDSRRLQPVATPLPVTPSQSPGHKVTEARCGANADGGLIENYLSCNVTHRIIESLPSYTETSNQSQRHSVPSTEVNKIDELVLLTLLVRATRPTKSHNVSFWPCPSTATATELVLELTVVLVEANCEPQEP